MFDCPVRTPPLTYKESWLYAEEDLAISEARVELAALLIKRRAEQEKELLETINYLEKALASADAAVDEQQEHLLYLDKELRSCRAALINESY